MDVLVTGATGLVGHAVAQRLLAGGHQVRALVRDVGRARRLLPPGIELVQGDVRDPQSLTAAVSRMRWVFHAAGLPEQWQRDERIFDAVNHQGTLHLLSAARAAGVERVIYTSTMDVFAAPRGGTLREGPLDTAPKPSAYERSKVAAEHVVERFLSEGMDLVVLHPSAVYGPSPVHVSLNRFFLQVLNRKAPLLPPGGVSIAYIDAVAEAHVVAAERAPKGGRYLLTDGYVTMRALAEAIVREGGLKKVPPTGPEGLLRLLARALAPVARVFRFTPLVAPGQLAFLLWEARVDGSRAVKELGYRAVPLEEGVRSTVAALRGQKLF